MKRSFFGYRGVNWCLTRDPKVDRYFQDLLSPFFCDIDDQTTNHFEIELFIEDSPERNEIIEFGTEIIIHNSKKPSVHENGLKLREGFLDRVFNLTTRSVYILNKFTNCIKIYNRDISVLAKDYIRVCRDIVKIIYEDDFDGVMLHAAAIEDKEKGCFVLVGNKGSGKTTISLDLLLNHGFAEIARDRAFISMDGEEKFICSGWPVYYNLTLRTIASFDQLGHLMPEKYKDLSPAEVNRTAEKHSFMSSELGIKSLKLNSNIKKIIVLQNLNNKIDSSIEDIVASSLYTPDDLNFPNWHFWIGSEKKRDRPAQVLRKITKSNMIYLCKWEKPSDAVDQILRMID